jgi:cytochrome c oxidase subunit 2
MSFYDNSGNGRRGSMLQTVCSRPPRPVTVALGSALWSRAVAAVPSALAPAGPDAARVAAWSWLLFGIAAAVFVVVTALIVFALLGRRRGGAVHTPLPEAQERRWFTFVLVAGGIVPAVVLSTVMGVNVFSERAVAAEAQRPALTVQVIGHQWWWEVFYPGSGFATANELHVPVGQRVELKLTSADVIHSFWVPQLSPKYDLIPGQTNTLTFTADRAGRYRGQCAELCGVQHAHMALTVVAQSPDDFARWTAAQRRPAASPGEGTLAFQGQQLFQGSACVYCHAVRGTNASSRLGPDLTHLATRMALGAGTLRNNYGNLAGWVVNAQAVKPGNKMPPMYLSAGELKALMAYLETLQ